MRATVWTDGCSGVVLSPRVVLYAGHCFGKQLVGCGPRYLPVQGPNGSYASFNDLQDVVKFVKVPPVDNHSFDDPSGARYPIAAVRVMPGFADPFGEICCPSYDPYCDNACQSGAFGGDVTANKHHDLAVVYLEEPIPDVTPDPAVFYTGSAISVPALGAYPLAAGSLVGKKVAVAGTSASDQSPGGRFRVYGPTLVTSIATPAALSPVREFETVDHCWVDPQSKPYSGVGSVMMFAPDQEIGACAVPGDSGGPTYANAPELGGDVIAGLPGRVVVGTHSALSNIGATSCDEISSARDTTTWNNLYPYDGVMRQGHNGDFIRKSLTDFDDDLVPDDFDNCPATPNPGQENCNAVAEEAKGYALRGDSCDPRPCAWGRQQKGFANVGSSSGNSFTKVVHGVMVRNEIEIDARPSMPHFNGSNDGKERDPLPIAQVPTKYRFCQHDLGRGVNCGADGTIDNSLANLPNGPTGPALPYLRMRIINGATYKDEEPFDYGSGALPLRTWHHTADYYDWAGQGWIGTSEITGLFGWSTGLWGRLWVHSETDVGRAVANSPTGYRVALDGTYDGDEELANHHMGFAPDATYTVTIVGALQEKPYFDPVWDPWDPYGPLGPEWDGLRGEASTIVRGYQGKYARILRSGEAVVIDHQLGAGLKSRMASNAVWAPAAEAGPSQAHLGPIDTPLAVAFDFYGTDVVDAAWRNSAEGAGNVADTGHPSLARSGGPTARTGFTPVYSRAGDLAFVVGGVIRTTGLLAGQIWLRNVTGPIPWTNLPLSGGYVPRHVRAATFSLRDHMLWVLDHTGTGVARLARIHPFTGHAEIVEEWTWTGDFDKHYLRLALDGQVILFASSTARDMHAAALLDVAPMKVGAPVTVRRFQQGSGPLLYRPNVDPRGVTFLTSVDATLTVTRQTEIGGGPLDLEDLGQVL